MSDLKTRVISGVIGLILLIGLVLIGGLPFKIGLLACSIIAFLEMKNALSHVDVKLDLAMGALAILSIFAESTFMNQMVISYYVIFYIAVFSFLFLKKSYTEITAFVFTILYIPVSFFTMSLIDDVAYIGLIFVIAFATDSFAYLVGSTIGKHKLIPSISPNKSVEGAIGGVLGSVVFSLIYLKIFSDVSVINVLIISIIGSVISQSGDLVASKIKRITGIKDYGKLIPGHGGIMDRFDSVILLTPTIFLLYTYLI